MALSTEETVRNAIVGAIQGVAEELGFDAPNGNVRDYLLEYHQDGAFPEYLMADIDGGRRGVRVWAVDVVLSDNWFAANNLTERTYTITVEGFEDLGVRGAGVRKLCRNHRIICGAIRALYSNLGGTVDLVESASELRRDVVSGFDTVEGKLLKGMWTYVASKENPDY